MNRIIQFFMLAALLVVAPSRLQAQAREDAAPQGAPAPAKQPVSDDKHLVYADFEKLDDNKKPISARGGAINIFGYQEQGSREPTFSQPELVHVKKEDPNHTLKFDYSLFAPTGYTGVTLEIHGQPDRAGNLVPDDVSGYKYLYVECYATGIAIVRLETVSKESGKDMAFGYPQYTFKVQPGLNTYRVPMKAFAQPAWIKDTRVDPRDIFKALTSINVTAFCDQCEANKQGMVILDNIVFEK